ncbi:MAG: hypothetical protein LBC09_06805, partial [Helicobacteraceae bacterium]|nr:hypothetical protein [Helicobacteraceae bacterium]
YFVFGVALLTLAYYNGVESYHPLEIFALALETFLGVGALYIGLFVSAERAASKNSFINILFGKDKDDDNASEPK